MREWHPSSNEDTDRHVLELGQQARLVRRDLGVADAPAGTRQLRRGANSLHVPAQEGRGMPKKRQPAIASWSLCIIWRSTLT